MYDSGFAKWAAEQAKKNTEAKMSGLIQTSVIDNLESIDRERISLQASMTIDSLLDELYTLAALEDSGEFWLQAANEEE